MADTITYEDIYELFRTEKYSTDLQQLKPEELKKIGRYFRDKKQLFLKQTKESMFFDKSKRDQLKTELENARRALKDFYALREKKLLSRAVFTCRTGLKDTTNMLASEEKLYLVLIDLLKSGSHEFFTYFVAKDESPIMEQPVATTCEDKAGITAPCDMPASTLQPSAEAPAQEMPAQEVQASAETPAPARAETIAPEDIQAKPCQLEQAKINLIKLKILEPIPELIGPDLQKYGPYEKDVLADVPEELARLLVEQKKAELIIG